MKMGRWAVVPDACTDPESANYFPHATGNPVSHDSGALNKRIDG